MIYRKLQETIPAVYYDLYTSSSQLMENEKENLELEVFNHKRHCQYWWQTLVINIFLISLTFIVISILISFISAAAQSITFTIVVSSLNAIIFLFVLFVFSIRKKQDARKIFVRSEKLNQEKKKI